MISWHLKFSESIFLGAGFAMLISVPLIHIFGFPLWAAVKIIYAIGILSLLVEMKRG